MQAITGVVREEAKVQEWTEKGASSGTVVDGRLLSSSPKMALASFYQHIPDQL
jgi:hypothetical protein